MPTNSKYYYYHKKPPHKGQKIYFCECGKLAVKHESGCWACADCLKKDEIYREWRRREAMRGVDATTRLKYIGGSKLNWQRYGRTA